MRICMVVPVPPPYGGIANWTKLISEYVQNVEGVEFTFVNTAPKRRSMDGRTLFDRVVVQGFEMFRNNGRLKELLKETKHDAVHMTTSGELATFRDILMLKTAKKMGIPTAYHIRFGRIPEIAKNNTFEWKRLKKAMTIANKVIVIDKTSYNAVKEYAPEVNVCYVPNPFDTGKIKDIEKIDETKKEIVFVGWVVKTKGVEELLCAWENVSEKFTDWMLKIVGPYSEEYKKELELKYSCKNVIFMGEKSHEETMKIISEASVFTLPSYTEGFPNAVLEAMALEKAIVATNVGAIPDMLDGCGIVIEPKNTQQIEEAFEKLLSDEALIDVLAKNAKEKLLRNFTIENVFDTYMSVWKNL